MYRLFNRKSRKEKEIEYVKKLISEGKLLVEMTSELEIGISFHKKFNSFADMHSNHQRFMNKMLDVALDNDSVRADIIYNRDFHFTYEITSEGKIINVQAN